MKKQLIKGIGFAIANVTFAILWRAGFDNHQYWFAAVNGIMTGIWVSGFAVDFRRRV